MKLLIPTIIGIILALEVKGYFPPLFEASNVITVTQVTIQRKLTQEEIIANTKHPQEIMAIWALESSLGKNDSCRYIGKWNGFGYRQNSFEHICYDSFEEVVGHVDNWLTQKDLENYCLYNKGIRTTDCPYALKAIKLLEP